MFAGDRADCLDLVDRVDRAKVARLHQIDRRRLALVGEALAGAHDRPGELGGIDLAVRPRHRDQLGAAAEETGGIALGGVHMRLRAAVHSAERRARGREGERVGGGAGGHRIDAHRRLEQGGEALLQGPGDRVAAVAQGRSFVGGDERLDQFRCGAAAVVASEIHGSGFMGKLHRS